MGRRSARDVSTSDYLERCERVFSGKEYDEYGMSAVQGARCPWMDDGRCHTNCMLFVTAVDADTVSGSTIEGEGHCSIAIAASHIASEKHYGGNYLVKTVAYNDEVISE